MKQFFIYSLMILSCISVQAQTPGYQGHKFGVYVSTALSPALYKDYLEEDIGNNSEIGKVGINARFDLSADYTLSKIVVFGGSVKHLSTKMPYSYYTTPINSDVSPYDVASFLGDIKLNANFGSFYFKFFPFKKKGAIAPVGHYSKLEMVFGKVVGTNGGFVANTYIGSNSHNNTGTLILPEFEALNYQVDETVFAFIYSFGNTWAFTDKLLFDFSTQFGYVFKTGGIENIFYRDNTGYDDFYFKDDALQRLNGTMLLNFNFGFGYLLF